MRTITVHVLWACADVLEIVRDGLIVLSTKAVGSLGEESSA